MGNTNKIDKKILLQWVVTIICTAIILFTYKEDGLMNWAQTKFFAVTLFFILLTAFELVPNMIIAMLLPFSYLLLGLAPATTVFSSYSNNVVWMVICGLIITNVLMRIGILNRIVYWCISKIGYSYRKIVFAFAVSAIVLHLVCPPGGYLVFAAVAYSFCKILKLDGTKTGTGIMLAGALMIGMCFVYSPDSQGLMISVANTIDPDLTLDYVSYFVHNLPMLIFYFIPYLLIPVLFKQDASIDENLLKEEVKKLGKMSTNEKKGAILTIIFVIYLLTNSIHNLGMQYGFLLLVAFFYLPGINIGIADDIKKANYPLAFFIASFISIGAVASSLEFNAIVSEIMVPLLSFSDTDAVIYTLVYLFGFLTNFLMTPLGALGSLSAPLTQIAMDMGLSEYAMLYAFNGGLYEVLLPYEIVKFLVFFAYGTFSFKDFAKLFGIRAILHLFYLPLVMVPYWHLIGLI